MAFNLERAEYIHRRTRLALLREIYRVSGRREAALSFIELCPETDKPMLCAELEHMEMLVRAG